MMNIELHYIDHLVMTVKDIDSACAFYKLLGMKVITFRGNRKALQFGNQKINLHEYQKEFSPHANYPTPGSVDLCLIAKTELNDVIAILEKHHIAIEQGPIERTGAKGKIISIYVRDPDGNLIEIANPLD